MKEPIDLSFATMPFTDGKVSATEKYADKVIDLPEHICWFVAEGTQLVGTDRAFVFLDLIRGKAFV